MVRAEDGPGSHSNVLISYCYQIATPCSEPALVQDFLYRLRLVDRTFTARLLFGDGGAGLANDLW
jgi:hypothetical protein